ncbi:MAG: hypothetical protein GTN38_00570 [Candidatus Aenigmarchaeota archaeon]|nr:hypothetical protein [Candidatus Aenigmarchaeota archaeon]NIP40078.1 hypothetical protein [Candidatus Aenigmarchaeota archaeon]NIQ18155.1 hypothetical protein [Candidatus Aenigmarchaeota archaeon]NIS72912.1 hypothetical protein [Candidatus Aenigmarchaeota archaeon]
MRGNETVTLHPFDPNLAPDQETEGWYKEPGDIRYKPAILASGNWSYAEYGYIQKDLHWLLFAANSKSANPRLKKITKPLYGHKAGNEVKLSRLGPELFKVSEKASAIKAGTPGDPTDPVIFETAAEWVYHKAESALIGLTGIEGGLALLKSKKAWRIDKDTLSSDIFYWNGRNNKHWSGILDELTPEEVSLIVSALKNGSLDAYMDRISESDALKRYQDIQQQIIRTA